MLGGMKCEKILVSEGSDDPSSVHGAGRRWRLHRKISDNLAEKRKNNWSVSVVVAGLRKNGICPLDAFIAESV